MPNTKIKKKAPEPPKPEKPVKPVVVAPNKPVDSDDAPDIPDPEEVKARKTKIKASQDVRRPTKGATNNPLENFSREDILRKGFKHWKDDPYFCFEIQHSFCNRFLARVQLESGILSQAAYDQLLERIDMLERVRGNKRGEPSSADPRRPPPGPAKRTPRPDVDNRHDRLDPKYVIVYIFVVNLFLKHIFHSIILVLTSHGIEIRLHIIHIIITGAKIGEIIFGINIKKLKERV